MPTLVDRVLQDKKKQEENEKATFPVNEGMVTLPLSFIDAMIEKYKDVLDYLEKR